MIDRHFRLCVSIASPSLTPLLNELVGRNEKRVLPQLPTEIYQRVHPHDVYRLILSAKIDPRELC